MQHSENIKQLATSKAEPNQANAIFYNGVECQGEHVIEDLAQRAMHNAGLPSWTSASTAQALQQTKPRVTATCMVARVHLCIYRDFIAYDSFFMDGEGMHRAAPLPTIDENWQDASAR